MFRGKPNSQGLVQFKIRQSLWLMAWKVLRLDTSQIHKSAGVGAEARLWPLQSETASNLGHTILHDNGERLGGPSHTQ